jgi:hypothetical protein
MAFMQSNREIHDSARLAREDAGARFGYAAPAPIFGRDEMGRWA